MNIPGVGKKKIFRYYGVGLLLHTTGGMPKEQKPHHEGKCTVIN
jgi:hypothetical protein